MDEPVYIRGYAAPFEDWTEFEGGYERFSRDAFDLSGPVDIRVHHDGKGFASTTMGGLKLFQDAVGLGFEAPLTPDCPLRTGGYLEAMASASLGVSVNMVGDWREEVDTNGHGEPLRTITRAAIDHIAFEWVPTYRNTFAWLSTWDVEFLRPVLRSAARRWAVGRNRVGPLHAHAPASAIPPAAATARSSQHNRKRRPAVDAALLGRIDSVLSNRPAGLLMPRAAHDRAQPRASLFISLGGRHGR